MCGRYFVNDGMIREIRRTAGYGGADRKLPERDVNPSEEAFVLAERHGTIRLETMRWGFPSLSGKGLIINARAESVLDRGMFCDSVLRRRCVIPADGFYEWSRNKEKAVFRKDGVPVLYMAGFYNMFGNEYRYVILTTDANSSIAPVHPRMPLVLEEDEVEGWLLDPDRMRRLLKKQPGPLKREQEYEQQTMTFL